LIVSSTDRCHIVHRLLHLVRFPDWYVSPSSVISWISSRGALYHQKQAIPYSSPSQYPGSSLAQTLVRGFNNPTSKHWFPYYPSSLVVLSAGFHTHLYLASPRNPDAGSFSGRYCKLCSLSGALFAQRLPIKVDLRL